MCLRLEMRPSRSGTGGAQNGIDDQVHKGEDGDELSHHSSHRMVG
jgi:hypothetical protein